MLPLIPIALSLAPQLAAWLFGAKAGQATTAIAAAASTITGTSDPAAQVHALQDPTLASQFQVALAKLAAAAQAETDATAQATLVATLGDIAGARSQTIALATLHSPVAWGAPIISAVVLATFGGMLGCLLTFPIPDSALALSNVMLGTLAAMATAVVNYWVGSSVGSARKSDTIADQSRQLAASTPPPH